MNKNYYVVAKLRSLIEQEDFKEENRKLLQTFESFSSLKEAKDFFEKQFFDDCDYGIFTQTNGIYYRV